MTGVRSIALVLLGGCVFETLIADLDVAEPDAGEPRDAPLTTLPVGDVILDCDVASGYEVDSFRRGGGDPLVWVGAIYQTHGDHGGGVHPMGEASVSFEVPGAHVLALSSYEPVTWAVEVGPDSVLEEILVLGFHEQVVQAPDEVPVTFVGTACGYSWPYNGGGCDTAELVAAIEAATGTWVHRYDGCYDASVFRWSPDLY